MESLLFFIICSMLVSILLGFAMANAHMVKEERGYKDERLQAMYASP